MYEHSRRKKSAPISFNVSGRPAYPYGDSWRFRVQFPTHAIGRTTIRLLNTQVTPFSESCYATVEHPASIWQDISDTPEYNRREVGLVSRARVRSKLLQCLRRRLFFIT